MSDSKASLRLALLLVMVSGMAIGAIFVPQHVANGQADLSEGCGDLNDPRHDNRYASGGYEGGIFWAGEVITIFATYSGNATIRFTFYDIANGENFVSTAPANVPLTFVVPNDTTQADLSWRIISGPETLWWDLSCRAPIYEPGCDMFLPLTGGVMGRFLVDTPAYWAPDASLPPSATLPAGQTAWVLGMDASGAYYRIAWVCDLLWVPVEAMGPLTGDPLWDGVPLPTGAAE